MKQIIGTLAYVTASAICVLTLFVEVPWPISTVSIILLVLGAVWSWNDSPTAPCKCPPCASVKGATADDVR